MTGEFYYCPESQTVIREDETYEVSGMDGRRCVHCAEWGCDQIVDLIADDDVDLGIVDYADQRGHDVAWMTAAERSAVP